MIVAQICVSLLTLGCFSMAGYGAMNSVQGWGWFMGGGLIALLAVLVLAGGEQDSKHCNTQDEDE